MVTALEKEDIECYESVQTAATKMVNQSINIRLLRHGLTKRMPTSVEQ